MDKQEEYVLRTVEERGIRFIRLWFTDVLGFLKSFAITPAELETAFEEGMDFDGSAIEGFSRVQESDMLARPDPTTFQILPWRDDQAGVARMFCDITMPDGEPFEGDPRSVLQRNLQRAADLGFTFYVGPEVEYFYFADSGRGPQGARPGRLLRPHPARRRPGVPAPHHHRARDPGHPGGVVTPRGLPPASTSSTCRYTDALTMADNLMTTRLAVKEVALEHGIYATFMPKPIEGVDGNGLHLHLSLFEGDRNAFYEAGADYGLSQGGPRVHRRPAPPRRPDHRHHQPVGELLQAPGRRLRRPGVRSPGPATTSRRWCGCPRPRRASRPAPASSTAPPTRPATPTWPSR